MYFKGDDFTYTFNGESKTREEIEQLIDYDTTVSIDGLSVNYFSPKKEIEKRVKLAEQFKQEVNNLETPLIKSIRAQEEVNILDFIKFVKGNKIQELLKEADEHQKQNGGILKGMEFPFDAIVGKKEKEQKVIEDWNRKEFYITPPSKENLERMCDSFEQIVENNSDKCGTIGNPLKQKFTEAGARAGQKHNEGKLPIDIMLTVQFPKAIQAVCEATLFGHEKYKDTDLDWLNYKRVKGGSTTYANACQRHNFNKSGKDEQSGLPHIVHKCWNALAELELWIEENKYE